jgi:hypothetical protein
MQASEWRHVLERATISGTSAAVLSSAVLAALGQRLTGSAAAPLNAVSHWYYGDRAARRDEASAKYTLVGYLTHHAASIFWAIVFERLVAAMRARHRRMPATTAVATAGLAALVDYTITPQRLTPGYEKRLPALALALVYSAFAVGLALAGKRR